MKIDTEWLLPNVTGQKKGVLEKKETADSRESRVRPNSTDRVNLSANVREMAELRQKLADIPDVRADRVSALKNEIAQGKYQVDGRRVAESMMRSLNSVGADRGDDNG